MAILIDMEMPRDCPVCYLAAFNNLHELTGCRKVKRYVPKEDLDFWDSNTRPSWCPLVEIPKVNGPLTDKELEDAGFEL